MSSSYKLLYRDRRQFVFEEAEETHTTAIYTLVAGFFAGSLLGAYFASLDATTAGSILLAIVTYITILTSTFSLKTNPLSVVLIFLTSFGAVIFLIYVARIVLEYFSDSFVKLVLVFSAVSALVAELLYLWSRITWVEDTRMHQLIEIASGDSPGTSQHYKELHLRAFFHWVIEILGFMVRRTYLNLRGQKSTAGMYPVLFFESLSKWSGAEGAKKIIITNQTLKRVKVCVYHRADYCCWVPVGGLTGGMYELERGEELVFSPHWPSSAFRVKIFAHGVIDYELASHPCVVRGHKYAFIDVSKPITALSAYSPPPSAKRVSYPSPVSDSSDDDHSEEEAFVNNVTAGKASLSIASKGLRRVPSSRANLSAAGSSHPSSPAGEFLITPTGKSRRQFKQYFLNNDCSGCISFLNESTGEIRVSFFNNDDSSFVRAMDSFSIRFSSAEVVQSSNLIQRNEWKVFEFDGKQAKDRFCVRVKSVLGQASLELSYCTAFLGEAFAIRDPIVSGS
jgi:hypothetical protein